MRIGPWKYKEGFAMGGGLFVTGLFLQALAGEINWDLPAFPVNLIVLLLFIGVLALMHGLRRRIYFFEWLGGYASAVSALICTAALTVAMGLIRQAPFAQTAPPMPVFSRMISAWPFVLMYVWLELSLGLTILRAGFPLAWRKIPFLLNHAGLFIVLLTASLGSADIERMELTVREGEAERRAMNRTGRLSELPLAIELIDFTIEEYPPKILAVSNETGIALPEGKPEHLLLEEGVKEGTLLDWRISVLRTLPSAAVFANRDTVNFTEFHSDGAAYAVYLKAVNIRTGEMAEGWVSGGSYLFPYKALRLDSLTSLLMPEREPRRYVSTVKVYTQKGRVTEDTVTVNHPLKIEGWKIYQSGYDRPKGRWSDISVFELVRDPWLPAVYTGIIMMAAGAVFLFMNSGKKKEEDTL